MKKSLFLATALCCATFATPVVAQPRPIATAPATSLPVALFGRLPSIDDPTLSPDGKSIAMKVSSRGEQYLAVMELDVPNPTPRLIAKDGDFDKLAAVRTVDWRWADADNLLIWIAAREDFEGQKYDADRVVAYNRKTGKITPLGWQGAMVSAGNVLWVSKDGPARILLSRFAAGKGSERVWNPEVVMVDVNTGKQELVQSQNAIVRNWYADGNGVVRMGSSVDRDTGQIKVLYRPDQKTPFRTIIKQKQEKYDTPPVPLIFLPGEKALVLSRKDGFTSLYEMDLNTMELGKKLFASPGYDVSGVRANYDGNALSSVRVVEKTARSVYFDPRLKEIQSILDESFGPGNASLVSTNRAQSRLIVRVGAPNQAGSYQLFDTATGDFKRIGWANEGLKDMALNPVKTVRYQASDGKTIEAVLTLPRLKPAKNLPLIVLPHGGPWARDYERFDMWAQPLAELGYAVIQPNFRGSDGYGKDWEAASDGNWGMRMQDDLLDAITYMSSQGIADKSRVCIFGWSYGGYAASRAAQRDGKYYRCAISGAGVHDLPDMVSYDSNYLGQYGSKYIGSAAGKLVDVSPARHAEQYSIPILIVHGAKDDRVPVSQSRNLVKRLKGAGKVEGQDFVYVEQPRNTHHLPLESDRIQLLEEIKKFLEQHNPA